MTKHTWEPPEKKHAKHEDAPEAHEDAPEAEQHQVGLLPDLQPGDLKDLKERIEEKRAPTSTVLSAPHQT